MTSDAKTKKPAAKVVHGAAASGASSAKGAAQPRVDREAALAITKGLTEAERDLVAGILDWQLEGLDEGGER